MDVGVGSWGGGGLGGRDSVPGYRCFGPLGPGAGCRYTRVRSVHSDLSGTATDDANQFLNTIGVGVP